MGASVLRYAAFTETPAGGNPAGVVLDADGLSAVEMLAIAAGLGYSETAFVRSRVGADGDYDVRYFSPLAEVPFCGHATVAAGVALAERGAPGRVTFHLAQGDVPVVTDRAPGGPITATLTSVPARTEPLADADLAEILGALGWATDDLDPLFPPQVGFAGAFHPIVAAATRERLARLDYDFDRLGALMAARDWTTIQLVWRERDDLWHSRNPFPPGGVVEDPATGAAAAALGAYLRERGLLEADGRFTILQGEDLGRPGRLEVTAPGGRAEVDVTGTAVAIPEP